MGLMGALLALAGACAGSTERNYEDPGGPLFLGRFGRGGADSSELRVVSFNVHFGTRMDRVASLLREAEPLRGADLLLIQELDETSAEDLARSFGLDYVYGASTVHPKTGRNFGNAIFTPWKIVDTGKILLPHRGRLRDIRRSAVTATVEIGPRRIQAYSIHLETLLELGWDGRRDQALQVLEDARRSPHPVVVGGDLNGFQLADLAEAAPFAWLTRDVGRTVSVFSWDHIYTCGFDAAGDATSGAVPSRGASDHRPVWAALPLGEGEPRSCATSSSP